ncbi:GH12 family glycosyl hydrolase domain-containing protein [Marispirochaeta aestuarii]|uniref:GH12 family glycosyl hydrolase domain-containing protein n=1 Tax=Marispirochaeta aestuarii TaxID=1963862 RepID=UPI002ABD421D|nr:hypothetical protein [Marispirochaeta aestuarii]
MRKLCNNGDFKILDKSYLYNNLWGEKSGSGKQCSWVETFDENEKDISWKSNWDWYDNDLMIKSYASIVYGWHWGWKVKDIELPAEINKLKEIKTNWDFDIREERKGNINITYDIWLSNKKIDKENPDEEIMVWVYKNGDVPPIGKKKNDIEIIEIGWELWEGLHPVNYWPVYSFITKANMNIVEFDVLSFIKEIKNLKSKYLLSVQSGIEVLSGKGNLETKKYNIMIK